MNGGTRHVALFRGSPRKNGNTNALADVFLATLRAAGHTVEDFDLHDMEIRPCLACRACQKDWSAVTCAQDDDMNRIFPAVLRSDLLVLATPIYCWYCTPPMKAMLDRLVYAMNMYYGDEKGPSLWAGRELALITTCGYPPQRAADLLEEGLKRYCRHSGLVYRGMLCERHLGYDTVFMDEEKHHRAAAFAESLTV